MEVTIMFLLGCFLLCSSSLAFSATPLKQTHRISSVVHSNLNDNDENEEECDGRNSRAKYNHKHNRNERKRREFLVHSVLSTSMLTTSGSGRGFLAPAWAAAGDSATDRQESLDVSNFLRTGMDSGGNMQVSNQAGKSRPQTGIFIRDGTDVSRDPRSGGVVAEIVLPLVDSPTKQQQAVLVSFESPWPLATGAVYDVECRDGKTGDGAFLSVSDPISPTGKTLATLPASFFLDGLFRPTGRFSFYGSPTDVKLKKDYTIPDNNNNRLRFLELTFSSLSQSTQSEVPRGALVAMTVPPGSDRAVMLVGSASAARWRDPKGTTRSNIERVAQSLSVVPSPRTSLKVRPKRRFEEILF